ncbi:hypothetical protein KAR52_03470 [Candidatus Pacearchaeota archaeon]|nr:hypothetical protein [Candidatus Pacearchaeota archaeon]
MRKIFNNLNKVGRNYVDNSFNLIQKEVFTFVINGENISSAINQKKNENLIIKVLNWFDDIWLYVEIRFVLNNNSSKKKRTIPSIFFTLSVFQGNTSNENKVQLFRAEWDNYEDLSDKHPQPHWHIYTQREIEDTSKSFDEIIVSTDESFKNFIEKDTQIVNIDKFHFAMNGQWSNNNSDVHKVEFESDLTNWFEGVLNHIKKELEFIKVK